MSSTQSTTSNRGKRSEKNLDSAAEPDTLGLDLEDKESRYIPAEIDLSRFAPQKSSEPVYQPSPKYTRVDYLQCHWKRRRELAVSHPELKDLPHYDNMTGFWVIFCVASMILTAFALRNADYVTIIVAAYIFGAFVDHALWVLIHDLTHNLAFKTPVLNVLFLILANMPHVIPSAVSFRYYHRLHHSHLNETYADPDIPGPVEATTFGRSTTGKILWLALFPFFQIVRTLRFSKNIFNHWMALNWAVCLGFGALTFFLWGPRPLVYLLVASLTSIGLHPIGARWVAEHYAVSPGQETYSYYGPLNLVAFNIGYHNEHHDLPDVPWSLLPRVRASAPEFYSHLYTHKSYLGVLRHFFFDPNFTLQTRVVRSAAKTLTKA